MKFETQRHGEHGDGILCASALKSQNVLERLERDMVKPLERQKSLLGEPDVTYCRGCRRRLRSGKSIERRYGPTCWKKSHSEPKGHNGADS